MITQFPNTLLSIPYLLIFILIIQPFRIKCIVQIGHLKGKKSKVLPYLNLWLISHIRYIIYSDKCFWIKCINEFHQLLIFHFIYDGDDFITLFHIVCTICFIYRCSTMQFMDDKFTKLFFFWCDDTYSSFNIMIKDKMIENNAIKISAKILNTTVFLS